MGRKEVTRGKILAAALAEFGKRGYDLASTNAMAEAAGVSKGVIFRHFGTKAELFFALFETEVDRMVQAVMSMTFPEGTPILDKIATVMVWKLDYATAHPETTHVLVEGLTHPPKGVEGKIYGLVG